MIFSRNRGSGRQAKDESRRASTPPDADAFEDELEPEESRTGKSQRTDGPFDVTEAPTGIAQLDLGALKLPAVEGVEVRVQADNDGKIQQIVLVSGESALQLGVFAAPRSEGIWDEVRGEIRKQLINDGASTEESEGAYGTELTARVRTPDGMTDIRFVGVDGPRWLVRAVFQGPAAGDPSAAPALLSCLRNLVVDRGQEAMPVREPLPLHLPKEVAEAGAEQNAANAAAAGSDNAAGTNGAGADGAAPPRRKPSSGPRRK